MSHPLLDSRASPEIRKTLCSWLRYTLLRRRSKLRLDDLRVLEDASFDFVQSYEDIYSFDPTSRTSNLHGVVLHISDCISNCGPAWVYW
ncbi:hypothetical protein V1506DRAFT_531173 [Lipomyces tetrasporus]